MTESFDLNIEHILEHWEIEHALREIIANALDEKTISNMDAFYENLDENCIPHNVLDMTVNDYEDFLRERRVLMSDLIRRYYLSI